MNKVEINGWIRITKAKARKLYDAGKTIRLCPVKAHPCNEYYPMSFDISLNDKWDVESLEWEKKFDSRVNGFEFYNCQYNELGKYTAFYIRKEELA